MSRLSAVACGLLLASPVFVSALDPLPNCDIFHDNQCSGSSNLTPDEFGAHRWFTPARGDDGWQDSFQDYAVLAANAHIVYSADRRSATVSVVTNQRDNSTKLSYAFNGMVQTANSITVDASSSTPITVQVMGDDGSKIELDPLDFVWNAPAVNPKHSEGDYRNGQKGAIVELFGWPHKDVEAECADLAEFGYMGVRVFPAMEQVMSDEPFNNDMNPWYFMYQPVSYRLQGRMGTRDDLRSMIRTCRSLGVRVYADAVINHMTGGGNDANPAHRNPNAGCTKWGAKSSSLPGGSSPFYTQDFAYTYGNYTQLSPSQEYPAANYGPLDFHCERALNSWTDPNNLNSGWLTGLADLNTERDNVQERIADYLTDLISIGFSGFRVDAAKHIKPEDLVAIFSKLKRNLGGTLPVDFISWWEVLLGGESDLLMCNANSGYNYGSATEDLFKASGFSQEEVNKIKIWNSGYPKETDKGVCTISKVRSAIQNDDHDQQNSGSSSRDMGDQGCVLIKGCDVNTHRNFEVKLFTSPNGASDNNNDFPIRMVLSSYWWQNGAQGVPDGLSDCSTQCKVNCGSCKSTTYVQARDASSKGYDMTGYTRVHRDATIINAMREWMHISGTVSADVM